ncbi:MAG: N-acetylglucosamine-6-phosphate deacetylase [Fimbriiglobus sp.]
MARLEFTNAQVVFPDSIRSGSVAIENGRIDSITDSPTSQEAIDLGGAYMMPGFIDLHVHGGDGTDFMDLTAEAFETVAICHARHGTTSLTPTSTVAQFDEYLRFLELNQQLTGTSRDGARFLGGHLYGPYFRPEAKGCHPTQDFLSPGDPRAVELLRFAGRGLKTLTVAPELPNSEALARAAKAAGCLVTAGHTYATFPEMEAAREWGVSHVDHLFCAMSDRARLRLLHGFPMQAGVMEATLFFDDVTTEIIADGMHIRDDLLRFAFKMKGPDRLALVTDAMRAVDCADGEYWFGAVGTGELIRKRENAGITLDGKGLASGVMGMDHCLRTMLRATGAPLPEVVRMATLTPARILGLDHQLGSIAVGKRADFVIMSEKLEIQAVYRDGIKLAF